MTTATFSTTNLDTLPDAVQKLFALKGQFASLRMVRSMKVRKGEAPITKDSTFTCRIGVDYDNIADVKEKREIGALPEENAGLPWGEWALFPYVITYKGNFYFRCTQVNGNANSTPKTRYLRNGQEITKDEAEIACLASEFKDSSDRNVFNVTISNLVAINGETI